METYQHISRFETAAPVARPMAFWLGCPAAAVAAFALTGRRFG
jgi:hypothetical protein